MTPKLEVSGLTVQAGSKRLLGPVNFAIPASGTLVIMGETGAGKSLLAQAILGALPEGLDAEGEIALDGNLLDQTLQGFSLRIQPSGAKSWVLRAKIAGKAITDDLVVPTFAAFARTYQERKAVTWKPSGQRCTAVYLRVTLLPFFGDMPSRPLRISI